ncbi:MAG: hypothetical protein ACREII_05225 [Nitrospiraceae bacterium]
MQERHGDARLPVTRRMLWLLAAGVLLGGEGGAALAQSQSAGEAVERVGLGQVNWTTGWINATGVGVPPAEGGPGARLKAERAGYVVALRNLLEIVKGVRVDGESMTDAYLVKNDVIRTQVSGFIQGAQIVKTVPHPDGSVEVTVKMPVWGRESLVSALLNEKAMQSYTLPSEADTKQGYTGIVIDARGMGVNPACFPQILDETGAVVYGPGTADRTATEKNGLVQYRALPQGAKLSALFGEEAAIIRPVQRAPLAREGRRPLKIKGLKNSGRLKANVIISVEDAKRIRGDAQLGGVLKRSRVVIITDPLIGGLEGRRPLSDRLVAATPAGASS